MDDNENKIKNQPSTDVPKVQGTVFENDTPQPIKVEEVAPGVESPEQIQGSIPPQYPTDIPVYEENNNKLFIIGGAIVIFLLVFGGIFWFFIKGRMSPTPPPAAEQITLTYWGLWDDKTVYDEVIKDYEKNNKKVTIDYVKLSPQQYRERLIARSKTGKGPDIFRYHNTWIPELKDVLTPLPSEIMTNEEFEKTFYPIHKEDLQVGDKYYGIPLMVDGLVLIYNDNLLKQAGVLTPPTTWLGGTGDVLNTVAKLTVKDNSGKIVTAGMAIGTATNVQHYGEIFGTLLLLNGGDLKKLNQQESIDALKLYRKFAEDGYWSDTMSNSISSFIQGRTAMIFGPTWHVINIKAQNPELKVKVAPIPKGVENTDLTLSNYWVEGVNKYSKNQLEAWKFLKYLSQKDTLTKIYETQAKTRLFGSAPSRLDMADTAMTNEYIAPMVKAAKENHMRTLPVVDRTYDNGLNDEILQYLQNAINQTANGVDYPEALKTAQEGITKVFEKYEIK